MNPNPIGSECLLDIFTLFSKSNVKQFYCSAINVTYVTSSFDRSNVTVSVAPSGENEEPCQLCPRTFLVQMLVVSFFFQ